MFFLNFDFSITKKSYQARPTKNNAMLANDANLFYLNWHVKTGLKAFSKSYQGDVVVFAFKFQMGESYFSSLKFVFPV